MTIKADTDQAKASINALNDAAGRSGSAAASRKSASFGHFRQGSAEPASIGRLRAGRSVENRPLRQPSWRIKLPRARKIRRPKSGLGQNVTIFVTYLLEMVNDLPPEKVCYAVKMRFLSNKSHKMGKNASWHGL